jgi:hypothetical protein
MFTREDALKAIREKFPETKTTRQKYWENGEVAGYRDVVWTPEKRLDGLIDLYEPTFDGLMEGNEGIDIGLSQHFHEEVEHYYKNENGLW